MTPTGLGFSVFVKRKSFVQGKEYCLFVGDFLVCRHPEHKAALSCLKAMTVEVRKIVDDALATRKKNQIKAAVKRLRR